MIKAKSRESRGEESRSESDVLQEGRDPKSIAPNDGLYQVLYGWKTVRRGSGETAVPLPWTKRTDQRRDIGLPRLVEYKTWRTYSVFGGIPKD